MTDDLDERCRQIEALLAYRRVGPLSAAAIAVNLGASASVVQEALNALVLQGRVVRVGLETYAAAPRQ